MRSWALALLLVDCGGNVSNLNFRQAFGGAITFEGDSPITGQADGRLYLTVDGNKAQGTLWLYGETLQVFGESHKALTLVVEDDAIVTQGGCFTIALDVPHFEAFLDGCAERSRLRIRVSGHGLDVDVLFKAILPMDPYFGGSPPETPAALGGG